MRKTHLKVTLSASEVEALDKLARKWSCSRAVALSHLIAIHYETQVENPYENPLQKKILNQLENKVATLKACLAAINNPPIKQTLPTVSDFQDKVSKAKMQQEAILEIIAGSTDHQRSQLKALLRWLPAVRSVRQAFASTATSKEVVAAHKEVIQGIELLIQLLKQLGLEESILDLAAESRKASWQRPAPPLPPTDASQNKSPGKK